MISSFNVISLIVKVIWLFFFFVILDIIIII
jgi:hypothetical protein